MATLHDNYPDGTWSGDPKAPWNAPNPPECTECFTEVEEDWQYCPYCGERIDWQADEYRNEVH